MVNIIPQTELAMRGSNGIGKGALKGWRRLVVHFDQEKTVLGDTCSGLSNTNIYTRQSTFVGPDGSSPARSGADKILEIWETGNTES